VQDARAPGKFLLIRSWIFPELASRKSTTEPVEQAGLIPSIISNVQGNLGIERIKNPSSKRQIYAPDIFDDEVPGEFEDNFDAQYQIRRFRREYMVRFW
jgi:hypothetical protein